jgi:hypothetical protein
LAVSARPQLRLRSGNGHLAVVEMPHDAERYAIRYA